MFPPISVAVHVTMVSPIGKNSGASFVIETTPKISSAIGCCNSTIFSNGTTASTIMSGIEDIVGGIVSTTSTCCVANAEFPLLSIAVQMIVDIPNGNKVGELLMIN